MSELFMVSRAAAEEIRRSMDLGDADGMGLRIAASRSPDGGIHYRMGFDERAPGDLLVQMRGVELLISSDHRVLLEGAAMDYVDLGEGQMDFIFQKPNDPHYQPPADE